MRLNMTFVPRFLDLPNSSFFLFGPRGTGKTTWLRQRFPSALFVNLLRPDTYRELSARPERLTDLARGAPEGEPVIVDEEVKTEGWVRNVGDFARFLEAMSFSHGGVLNVSNVARECQVRRTTVEGFLGVLEDLLLGFRLPVFTGPEIF